MQAILINRTKSDLKRQFKFLKQLENSFELDQRRLYISVLIGLTLAIFLLLTFTDINSLITFKAISFVLICLLWILAIVYSISFYIKRWRRNKWISNAIEETLKKNQKDYITFDEEFFSYGSEDFKTELNWTYFKAYLEDKDSIYLFPLGTIYQCHSFSSYEIGEDNLVQLKNIAKSKIRS